MNLRRKKTNMDYINEAGLILYEKFGYSPETISKILDTTAKTLISDLRLPLIDDLTNSGFRIAFMNRMMELYMHLDKDSHLYSDVLNNELQKGNYDILKRCNYFKWAKCWKKYEDFEKKHVEMKRIGNTNERCHNCSSTNTNVTFVQMRSADEGTSRIFECFNCGITWKRH